MISTIIYIENTTFDWAAPVSDFSTHFLLSKAKLWFQREQDLTSLTRLMCWNNPGTSLVLGVGKSKVCACGSGEGVREGKCC